MYLYDDPDAPPAHSEEWKRLCKSCCVWANQNGRLPNEKLSGCVHDCDFLITPFD